MSGSFVVNETASQFEVAISDSARWIGPTDKIGDDIGLELGAPNNRLRG
jgi:hypothetical protein